MCVCIYLCVPLGRPEVDIGCLPFAVCAMHMNVGVHTPVSASEARTRCHMSSSAAPSYLLFPGDKISLKVIILARLDSQWDSSCLCLWMLKLQAPTVMPDLLHRFCNLKLKCSHPHTCRASIPYPLSHLPSISTGSFETVFC